MVRHKIALVLLVSLNGCSPDKKPGDRFTNAIIVEQKTAQDLNQILHDRNYLDTPQWIGLLKYNMGLTSNNVYSNNVTIIHNMGLPCVPCLSGDRWVVNNILSKRGDYIFEKSRFYSHQNGFEMIHSQFFNFEGVIDANSEQRLTITFEDWNKIELNKEYSIDDFPAYCVMLSTWERHDFHKPAGTIRLTLKNDESLTFQFNLNVFSKDGKRLWIYDGERTFKKEERPKRGR
jgi:hypothetical protein